MLEPDGNLRYHAQVSLQIELLFSENQLLCLILADIHNREQQDQIGHPLV